MVRKTLVSVAKDVLVSLVVRVYVSNRISLVFVTLTDVIEVVTVTSSIQVDVSN